MRTLAGAVLLAAVGLVSPAAADVADEILAKAIESYKAGDLQPALGGINAAMRNRLSGSSIPRAYYYQGLVNRRLGQPGRAITDLTRALEYDGLTEAERTDAQRALEGAYQEAGISPNEKVIVAKPSEDEQRPPVSKAAVKSAAAPEPPSVPPFSAPVVTGSLQSQVVTTAAPTPAWQTMSAPAAAPPKPSPPAPPKPDARSSAPSSQQIALAPLPPIPMPPKTSAPAPQKKQVASLAPFVTEVSAAPQLTAAPAEVRLLVGEAGSRSDAIALAVRLTSQRGAELGPRRPQIARSQLADTQVYQVLLGPFTDPMHATSLCRSLRDSGYACVAE